jgi:hypothetical protein
MSTHDEQPTARAQAGEPGDQIASGEAPHDDANASVSVVGRRRGVRDLADGTLRVVVELATDDRKKIFLHFSEPSMPVAIQLLRGGAGAVRCTKRSFSTIGRDGLQLTLDVDPESRKAFLEHYYDFDAEIVLVPLRCQDALQARRNAAAAAAGPARRRLGAMEALARSWPREARFLEWLAREVGRTVDEPAAAALIKDRCGVNKRSEIDDIPEARRRFDEEFRRPYRAYLVRIGAA